MPDADPPEPDGRESSSPFWRELPFLVIVALGLALLIKSFLVQAFYIPSASMEDTLQGGQPNCTDCGSSPGHPFDRVLVNKLVYDLRSPRRGEVVVFKGPPRWPDESQFTTPSNPIARVFHDISSAVGLAPSSDSDFIKRVIGVGGDTISCRHDQLYVDNHVLSEPFLYPGSHPCSSDSFNGRTVHVPNGDIFVMGDHRNFSDDSRMNGPVPVSDVVGRAFVVIWPASDWKTLPIPATFKQAGLDVTGSDTGIVVVAIIVVGAALLGWLAVVRRRRKGRSTYAAADV
ncbi:MAG TPA: signal peptidase I [Mycobacteriales bacterium]|jgi:signal peptidase I|nr:signal peptidase I [Mycobacteriales bacterium]